MTSGWEKMYARFPNSANKSGSTGSNVNQQSAAPVTAQTCTKTLPKEPTFRKTETTTIAPGDAQPKVMISGWNPIYSRFPKYVERTASGRMEQSDTCMLPSVVTWSHRRPRREIGTQSGNSEMLWRITNAVHASGHSIRERPNAYASAIATVRRGDSVYGVLENAEWLKLSRQPGYCRLKGEDGTVLVERADGNSAEELSTIPVPIARDAKNDPISLSFKDKKALFERQPDGGQSPVKKKNSDGSPAQTGMSEESIGA